jgi:hypothetical protein
MTVDSKAPPGDIASPFGAPYVMFPLPPPKNKI